MARIWSLAWGLLYAAGVARKGKKKNCNQITAILQCHVFCSIFYFCSSSVFICITIVHSFSLMYSNPPCECTTIYFYFIVFQGATPVAYGSSLATAASLHHSSQQLWILNPPSEARDQTHTLMILVVFITAEPQRELLYYSSLIHSTLDGHLVFSLSSGLLWILAQWTILYMTCARILQAIYLGVKC